METRRCALVTPPSTHAVVCIGSLVVAVGAVVAAYWRGRRDGSGMMSERRSGGGIAARTSSAATTAPTPPACGRVYDTIADMIGGTPMLRVSSLSRATGCSVYLKMESSNPAGSSKDRIARQIIEEAVHDGRLQPGGWVVEGTSGSTGVSLALLCRTLGYRCVIVMPDDQAAEKIHLLRSFGALVHVVKPAAIVNTNHYVNVARRVAQALSRGECIEAALGLPLAPDASLSLSAGTPASAIFCDQFETAANVRAHESTTGPEIWLQLQGKLDAFVSGAGTGGTLSGVALYLARVAPHVRCFLVDPPGSSLYNKVKHGVAYASQQCERRLRRHRYDTIIEGVGIDRVTSNFAAGEPLLAGAFSCTDEEAVAMSRYLLLNDGIFAGSSTAMNCVGVVKLARQLPPGSTIVSICCDSGLRHLSRLWNPDFLATRSLDAAAAAVHGDSLDFVLPAT